MSLKKPTESRTFEPKGDNYVNNIYTIYIYIDYYDFNYII